MFRVYWVQFLPALPTKHPTRQTHSEQETLSHGCSNVGTASCPLGINLALSDGVMGMWKARTRQCMPRDSWSMANLTPCADQLLVMLFHSIAGISRYEWWNLFLFIFQLSNVVLMLGHYLRRWPTIKTTLRLRHVFAGYFFPWASTTSYFFKIN